MRVRSTEDLGAVVRDRRRALGLSQAEVAARADVTRQWVVRFEQGSSDVSLRKTLALLRALDLDLRTAAQPRNDASNTSQPVGVPITIPRIDVPRIDLSNVDWAKLSSQLARTQVNFSSLDMSTLLSDLRSGDLAIDG